jgi:hypothetical protein
LYKSNFVVIQPQEENATSDQCYNAVLDIINDVKTAIQNNPTLHINQLNFFGSLDLEEMRGPRRFLNGEALHFILNKDKEKLNLRGLIFKL